MAHSIQSRLKKAINIRWWIDSFYYARAVAIDISPLRVTAAYIDKNVFGIKLIDWGSYHVDIIRDKKVKKEEEGKLLTSVRGFLEKNRIGKDIEFVVGLPRKLTICKFIEIPSPDEKSIRDILSFDIERHIPVVANEIYYDFEVIEKRAGNRFKVMLIAIKKEVADYYIGLFNRISVNIGVIYISSFAGINLYSMSAEDEKGTKVFVHKGYDNFEFLAMQNRRAVYTKNYKALPADYPWLRSLSIGEYGAVKECGEFVFNRYIETQSLLTKHEQKDISGIALTGGGNGWKMVCAYLEKEKRLNAIYLDPVNSFLSVGLNGADDNHNLPVAIGLGLRGVSNLFLNVNLMPGSKKGSAKNKSVIVTMVLIVLFFLSVLSSLFSGYVKDRIKLYDVEKELSLLKKNILEIEGFGIKSEELKKRIEEFSSIRREAISKLKVVKELSGIIPPPIWITDLRITGNKLNISGYANAASDLIKIMEDSPLLNDVRFLGTIKKDKGREKFKIEAVLE